MPTDTARPAAAAPETPDETPSDSLSIDSLVDHTPASRDRYVDFLRALSIIVVVLWHWVFSITQWNDDGSLGMPNPIGDVPGLWLATWLLQIMPVFFFVGGYANLASLTAVEQKGGTRRSFLRSRLHRLLKPVGLYVGIWAVADLVARLVLPGYTGVLHWGFVVFVPLWFLGVYVGVTLAAPWLAHRHRAAPIATIAMLAAAFTATELVRRTLLDGTAATVCALVGSVFVWLFVHQLGFFWRDGTLARGGRRLHAALALAGLSGLILLTGSGAFPRSMVSVRDEGSNILPTTPCIALLAVFQLGVVLLLKPAMDRWLQRRGPWKFTVAVNAVAMTVFCWHMTALVIAIGGYQLLGGTLLREASATWWLHRPLWLVLPGVVLAGLVALFARFELPTTRAAREDARGSGRPAGRP